MTAPIAGIHHVTAIATNPQRNFEFYSDLLGLRLVKLTVNFDDPYTYHLYYGDATGSPGTILTFFPWPGASHGVPGSGQATVTTFSIPEGSLHYWEERLEERGVAHSEPFERLGEQGISFSDPDGLQLEFVAEKSAGVKPWEGSQVPAGHAVRGFRGVTLSEADPLETGRLLSETMGFTKAAESGERTRYIAAGEAPGRVVDLVRVPRSHAGMIAGGSVHHVAWRAAGYEEQKQWRAKVAGVGLHVTPVIDRNYFRSVYFREPGGVLFEIATDPPGFTVDEPEESLGLHLKLPPQYEPMRASIEKALPPLRLPAEVRK